MAGAFSGHLLNAFTSPGQSSTSNIITSGAMSFDSRAHGTPAPSLFSSLPTPHTPFCFAPSAEDSTTAKNIATLQAKLNKKLGPEYISQRPGPGGGPKLTYAEGWKIINLANEVFGFNGWNSSIVSIATDFVDYSEDSKRFNVGVTAIVRVTLRDGTYHEDVGYGLLENSKSKAAALDKCKKEAITDALKRTLRNFGNLLGNCLYDKSYAQEVVKIKVPPAKFDKSELYRRPEFEDASVNHGQTAVPGSPSTDNRVKTEHDDHQAETPITYVPRHMRQEIAAAARQAQASTRVPATPAPRASTNSHSESGSGNTSAVINRGPIPVNAPKPSGLATPVQTPAAPRPLPPQAPPSRLIATSPLSRVRSAPERTVSFTEPMLPRANSTDTADQDTSDTIPPSGAEDDDDDAFPISTQEGALFATIDLGEGDLGRPIDYEEGMGSVSMLDTSVCEPGVDNAGLLPARPQLQAQVRDRIGGGPNTGLSSSVTNIRTEGQKSSFSTSGSANATPIPSTNASSGTARPQPRSGTTSLNVASTSTSTGSAGQEIKRLPARPVTPSTGGFHPAPTTKPSTRQQQQPRKHTPNPVPPASARPPLNTNTNTNMPQLGPSNTLKRTADMMHVGSGSGSGSSSRPPIQGTGLAPRQQQQQSATARRPSDDNVGNDPKRLRLES